MMSAVGMGSDPQEPARHLPSQGTFLPDSTTSESQELVLVALLQCGEDGEHVRRLAGNQHAVALKNPARRIRSGHRGRRRPVPQDAVACRSRSAEEFLS